MTDPIENGPGVPNNTEPTPENPGPKTGKVALGAVLIIMMVTGLYLINRYWIAPATKKPSKITSGRNHPVAPTFKAIDLNGRKLDFADYKGKVILLDFWATWCGPCRIEIPGFVKLRRSNKNAYL